MNAKHTVFSSVRKAGSTYVLGMDFADLGTGVHCASIKGRQYGSFEPMYSTWIVLLPAYQKMSAWYSVWNCIML